jgi:soluble P-type ATPase
MLTVPIPGAAPVTFRHLVIDANGTLTDRGAPIPGVAERIARIRATLDIHVASADTFGTAEAMAASLGADFVPVATGVDKVRLVERLGAGAVIAVGNGRNDAEMFRAARLAIAVVGPEGAAVAAIQAADVVCRDICNALDMLLDEKVLIATLRP